MDTKFLKKRGVDMDMAMKKSMKRGVDMDMVTKKSVTRGVDMDTVTKNLRDVAWTWSRFVIHENLNKYDIGHII